LQSAEYENASTHQLVLPQWLQCTPVQNLSQSGKLKVHILSTVGSTQIWNYNDNDVGSKRMEYTGNLEMLKTKSKTELKRTYNRHIIQDNKKVLGSICKLPSDQQTDLKNK